MILPRSTFHSLSHSLFLFSLLRVTLFHPPFSRARYQFPLFLRCACCFSRWSSCHIPLSMTRLSFIVFTSPCSRFYLLFLLSHSSTFYSSDSGFIVFYLTGILCFLVFFFPQFSPRNSHLFFFHYPSPLTLCSSQIAFNSCISGF